MRPNMKKILQPVLLAVFLLSTALLIPRILNGMEGDETYSDALNIALQQEQETGKSAKSKKDAHEEIQGEAVVRWIPAPVEDEDPNMQTMAQIDLDALRQVNPDVTGWIMIPDTEVNYPILQGEDNDFYLNHTWEKEKNSVGSIFLEYQNSSDFTDFNTIVYGHNMNNGSMFATLRKYTWDKYRQEHPYVYIATDEGVLRYEIFSTYQAKVDSKTYGISFNQQKTRAEYLLHAIESSSYEMDIHPQITDRILTLSTCSGAGYTTRWVVHARLRMIQQE